MKNKNSLKEKVMKDFHDWFNQESLDRPKRERVLLRSFNNNQYLNTNEPDKFGAYPYFKAAIKAPYNDGIEFFWHESVVRVQVFKDNTWEFILDDKAPEGEEINVHKVGRINYTDLVDYCLNGDEDYNYPILDCKFLHNGTPFESNYYRQTVPPHKRFEVSNRRS